jgi:hypothetical protein
MDLLSINVIESQLKCVALFDIPKMIFQEKGADKLLGTDAWHNGLWYMNREGMDSTLSSIIRRLEGLRGV